MGVEGIGWDAGIAPMTPGRASSPDQYSMVHGSHGGDAP